MTLAEPTAIPILRTARLELRGFAAADAPAVAALCNDRRIYQTTLAIPFPYAESDALAWFASHAQAAARGESYSWAITRQADGQVLGAIGLQVSKLRRAAEVGYWIGVPYWRQGFMTEACQRVVAWAFTPVHEAGAGLVRVFADHMLTNPASGRVLAKAGMRFVAMTPSAGVKEGQPVDTNLYAITRQQWLESSGGPHQIRGRH